MVEAAAVAFAKSDASNRKKEKILKELNDEQKLPVLDYMGPSIILAAAGAGKTHTVVSRAAYMIEDGVMPRNILLFTFTKKAADEIRDRVAKKIGHKGKDITVGTYHSFCAQFLRKHIEILNIWTKNFTIYDSDDSLTVMKDIVKGITELKDTKPQAVLSQISIWKRNMLSPKQAGRAVAKDGSYVEKAMVDAYEKYEKTLKNRNALDFDGLLYVAVKILRNFSDIRKLINNRYKFIVVDESQDSSPRDLELIELIGGEDMNVCLVGDDWQSIYSFRGSNIQAFFDFVEKYNLKQFYLNQNYRSTKTIVAAAQSVIDNNEEQFRKETFTNNSRGIKIVSLAAPTSEIESIQVVKIIKNLQQRGFDLEDIAVLYRMSYLSKEIEKAFISSGINYKMTSGTPFYERKEIKDVMAYLKLLYNPYDTLALCRAINRPKRNIGDKSLKSLIKACTKGDTGDIISVTELRTIDLSVVKGAAKKGVQKFLNILDELEKSSKMLSPGKMILKVIELTDYIEFIKSEESDTSQERIDNLQQLISIADSYEDLSDFIENMVLNESEKEENGNAVSLMTVHGSKGLEFRAVIIIGCNEGVFPHYKAMMSGNVEEERRMFYVAMTRAKELLFLTRPRAAFVQGRLTPQTESSFIKEIDKSFLVSK